MIEKDQGIIKDRYEIIIRELQNMLAFGYLCLVILGMVFEVGYYSFFDINIFEFAGISDFLLAPFRRPASLVMLAFIGLYVLFTYPLDVWMAKKWPKFYRVMNMGLVRAENSTRYRNLLFAITATVLTIIFSAKLGVRASKELKRTKNNIHIIFSEGYPDFYGKKVGQTSAYLFVMDSLENIKVIPIASQVLLMEQIDLSTE